MKVYTSGVYGELVLRSATTWPSGLFLVMVICSLCRTLEEMQDDAVTSGNNVFFVFLSFAYGMQSGLVMRGWVGWGGLGLGFNPNPQLWGSQAGGGGGTQQLSN